MTGKSNMDEMYLIPMQQQILAARQELRECNAYSGRFGLTLHENEIAELTESRAEVLRAAGKAAMGGGRPNGTGAAERLLCRYAERYRRLLQTL